MSRNTSTAGGAARAGIALLAAGIGIAAAGCAATITPADAFGVAYEENGVLVRAEVVPPDIWAYPHVVFGGSYAYLVDGIWYYPTPSGWMVFRREPVELSRQRTRLGTGRWRTPYQGYPGR